MIEYHGPSTRKNLYYAMVDYLLRKDRPAETIACPDYPALRLYGSATDEMYWVKCDDPVILRSMRYIDNWALVNEAGKKLVHDTFKPDVPYVGYDIT